MKMLSTTVEDRPVGVQIDGKKTPSVPSGFLDEIPDEVTKKLDRYEKLDPEAEKAYVKKLYENFMAKLES